MSWKLKTITRNLTNLIHLGCIGKYSVDEKIVFVNKDGGVVKVKFEVEEDKENKDPIIPEEQFKLETPEIFSINDYLEIKEVLFNYNTQMRNAKPKKLIIDHEVIRFNQTCDHQSYNIWQSDVFRKAFSYKVEELLDTDWETAERHLIKHFPEYNLTKDTILQNTKESIIEIRRKIGDLIWNCKTAAYWLIDFGYHKFFIDQVIREPDKVQSYRTTDYQFIHLTELLPEEKLRPYRNRKRKELYIISEVKYATTIINFFKEFAPFNDLWKFFEEQKQKKTVSPVSSDSDRED